MDMNYTLFGKTGLNVSPLALGTGNFGTGWGHGADPETAGAIFNAYAEAGGNFIDTADVYQFGQFVTILGELLQGPPVAFVLETQFPRGDVRYAGPLDNGNSSTALVASVEPRLSRLNTDSIVIHYAHLPDHLTPFLCTVPGF